MLKSMIKHDFKAVKDRYFIWFIFTIMTLFIGITVGANFIKGKSFYGIEYFLPFIGIISIICLMVYGLIIGDWFNKSIENSNDYLTQLIPIKASIFIVSKLIIGLYADLILDSFISIIVNVSSLFLGSEEFLQLITSLGLDKLLSMERILSSARGYLVSFSIILICHKFINRRSKSKGKVGLKWLPLTIIANLFLTSIIMAIDRNRDMILAGLNINIILELVFTLVFYNVSVNLYGKRVEVVN